MIVPIHVIPNEQLEGLMEEYVLTMQGNDIDDTPMEDKLRIVKQGLVSGELVVSYSELHESVSIRRADEYQSAN